MPINVYTGLMGSGKSYECVSSVIVPAVRQGRRVVTNVDGIDSEAIRVYCAEKFGISLDKLGHVVHCTNDDVLTAGFLPHGEESETFCKPGDLICIDEAWRFWGTDCKLLAEHKVFFREHRHYVHPETKVSCDLALMVQDISDLHRTLRVVVELTFRTTKIKTLGWDKTYRVEMWEGYKLTRKGRVAVQNKRYSKAIFPLYSSYSGGKGKELQVDSRQNVLRNPKLWILAVLVVCMFGFGLKTVLSFFSGDRWKEKGVHMKSVAATGTAGVTAVPDSKAAGAAAAPAAIPGVSSTWRLVGTLQAEGKFFVVLEGASGRMRVEHPSNFQNVGAAMVGSLDGQRVMMWSGPQAMAGSKP